MEVIPLELQILIAVNNPVTFARFIRASKRFYNYILTPNGQACFLRICMKKEVIDTGYAIYSLITGHMHSFYDQPAIVCNDGKIACHLRQNNDFDIPVYNRVINFTVNSTIITRIWYKHGVIHRDNGPALVRENGDQLWIRNNQLHRINGPAVTYIDGSAEWWQYNRRHRDDGPAIMSAPTGRRYRYGINYHNDKSLSVDKSMLGDRLWYRRGVRVHTDNDIKSTICSSDDGSDDSDYSF